MFFVETMDSVHYFIFHIFEVGLRTPSIPTTITNDTDHDEKSNKDEFFDAKFAELRQRINDTRVNTNTFRRFGRQANNSKFSLNIQCKHDQIDEEESNESEQEAGTTFLDSVFDYLQKMKIDHVVINNLQKFLNLEEFDTECLSMDLIDHNKPGNIRILQDLAKTKKTEIIVEPGKGINGIVRDKEFWTEIVNKFSIANNENNYGIKVSTESDYVIFSVKSDAQQHTQFLEGLKISKQAINDWKEKAKPIKFQERTVIVKSGKMTDAPKPKQLVKINTLEEFQNLFQGPNTHLIQKQIAEVTNPILTGQARIIIDDITKMTADSSLSAMKDYFLSQVNEFYPDKTDAHYAIQTSLDLSNYKFSFKPMPAGLGEAKEFLLLNKDLFPKQAPKPQQQQQQQQQVAVSVLTSPMPNENFQQPYGCIQQDPSTALDAASPTDGGRANDKAACHILCYNWFIVNAIPVTSTRCCQFVKTTKSCYVGVKGIEKKSVPYAVNNVFAETM